MSSQDRPALIFSKRTWEIILAAWIFIWGFVIFKDLFFKGYLRQYSNLLKRRTLDGKRSFVTGDDLYELIQLCKASLPEGATFGYRGIKEGWIEDRRIRYYLYPNLKSEEPDYIIVFNDEIGWDKKGWQIYRRLDEKRFILKR